MCSQGGRVFCRRSVCEMVKVRGKSWSGRDGVVALWCFGGVVKDSRTEDEGPGEST